MDRQALKDPNAVLEKALIEEYLHEQGYSFAALNELPEEFRTPLVLFYFEEFSYKRIAEVLPWLYLIRREQGEAMQKYVKGYSHLAAGAWNQITLRETWLDK